MESESFNQTGESSNYSELTAYKVYFDIINRRDSFRRF